VALASVFAAGCLTGGLGVHISKSTSSIAPTNHPNGASQLEKFRLALQELRGRLLTADIMHVFGEVLYGLYNDGANHEQPFAELTTEQRVETLRLFRLLNQQLPESSWLYESMKSSVSNVNFPKESINTEFPSAPFNENEVEFTDRFLEAAQKALIDRNKKREQQDVTIRNMDEFAAMAELFNENSPYRLPQAFEYSERNGIAAVTFLVNFRRNLTPRAKKTILSELQDLEPEPKLHIRRDIFSVFFWYAVQMGGPFDVLYKELGDVWPTGHPDTLRPIREVLFSQDRTWVSMIKIFYASHYPVANEYLPGFDSEILDLSWGEEWLRKLQDDTSELGKQRLERKSSDRHIRRLD